MKEKINGHHKYYNAFYSFFSVYLSYFIYAHITRSLIGQKEYSKSNINWINQLAQQKHQTSEYLRKLNVGRSEIQAEPFHDISDKYYWETVVLRKARANQLVGGYVIIAVINYHHMQFARNWIKSLEWNNYKKFLILCLDNESY